MERLVRGLMWLALFAAIAWALVYPKQASGVVVAVIGGVVTLVHSLFNGVSAIFV